MPRILKITDAASLALHTAVLLAAKPDRPLTAAEAAWALRASTAHISKVLQRLARAGIVLASRGPRGGYRLAKEGDDIRLLEVFEAIEGPFPVQECLLESQICDGVDCILGGLMSSINRQVRAYLEETKLTDLTCVYKGLQHAKA